MPQYSPAQVCNLDYLVQVTKGNTKAIAEIVAVFFNETEQELVLLNNAIDNSNYQVIGSISHKIKPAFMILGIAAVENIFKEIEQLSSSKSSISRIKQLNQQVNCIFNQARTEMTLKN
jgi:HPt (histidine-containing phosphotransfer) domain-containing protein